MSIIECNDIFCSCLKHISICFYGESILLKAESFAKVVFISKRFMSFYLFFLDFIGNAEIYI